MAEHCLLLSWMTPDPSQQRAGKRLTPCLPHAAAHMLSIGVRPLKVEDVRAVWGARCRLTCRLDLQAAAIAGPCGWLLPHASTGSDALAA